MPLTNNKDSTKQADISISTIGSKIVEESVIHSNVTQEFIVTTEDKVRLCLSQHLHRMERKKAWIAPVGVFIALLTALLTTTFNNVGVKAEVWQAIFIICCVISFIWSLYTLKDAFRSETVDNVIEELKQNRINEQASVTNQTQTLTETIK